MLAKAATVTQVQILGMFQKQINKTLMRINRRENPEVMCCKEVTQTQQLKRAMDFIMILGPDFAQRFVSSELTEEEVIVKWGLKENADF